MNDRTSFRAKVAQYDQEFRIADAEQRRLHRIWEADLTTFRSACRTNAIQDEAKYWRGRLRKSDSSRAKDLFSLEQEISHIARDRESLWIHDPSPEYVHDVLVRGSLREPIAIMAWSRLGTNVYDCAHHLEFVDSSTRGRVAVVNIHFSNRDTASAVNLRFADLPFMGVMSNGTFVVRLDQIDRMLHGFNAKLRTVTDPLWPPALAYIKHAYPKPPVARKPRRYRG